MKSNYILNRLLVLMVLSLTFSSCTELENENFSEFIADEFTPSESDLPRITRAAYGDWRKVLLLWDGYWRVQEVSADGVVIPARPNGWVDGGVHKRIFMHTWLPSDPIVNETWY